MTLCNTKLLCCLAVLCASLATSCAGPIVGGPDAPRIKNFKFETNEFVLGQEIELSFDYYVKGGINNSKIVLDYQGSAGQSRRNSRWEKRIQIEANALTGEKGTLTGYIFPKPTDTGPFDITYFLQIIDSKNRGSEEATATIRYKGSL